MNKQDNFVLSLDAAVSKLGIDRTAQYIIGVSGGVDSMVLLHACIELQLQVIVCHVNYKKRGIESDFDEALVKRICESLSIPFYSRPAPDFKGNFQAAARDFRYAFFEEKCVQNGAVGILTAHHADDAVESYFMNLMRGSSLKGLVSLAETRKNIYRPLIQFSKDEIKLFAAHAGVEFRVDQSNSTTDYRRNVIRHELIPIFNSIDASAQNNIQKSVSLLRNSHAAYVELLDLKLKEYQETRFGIRFFKKPMDISESLKLELYTRLFYQEIGVDVSRIKSLDSLLSGSCLEGLSEHVYVYPDGFWIVSFLKNVTDVTFPGFTIFLNTESEHKNCDTIFLSEAEYGNCFFRTWKAGDRMIIHKSGQAKKLQDIFVDAKIPIPVRRRMPILVEENGHVIWIPFVRVSTAIDIPSGNDKVKLSVQTLHSNSWD